MSNIWEFLYQTLSVSLAAAVLLAVKWLLRDKLSPRWQYAVWGVLALRALIPASLGRSLVPQLALWTGDGEVRRRAGAGFGLHGAL